MPDAVNRKQKSKQKLWHIQDSEDILSETLTNILLGAILLSELGHYHFLELGKSRNDVPLFRVRSACNRNSPLTSEVQVLVSIRYTY